ncbi:hypothetical protein AX17_006276 [Amanita inopinata Kibby_2008]|nr:hypothetical protein AX17_006276 [Amanita inopinata Kibby_2008]
MSMDVNEASVQILDVVTEPGETIIPSESSVKVAKERRERLRKSRIAGEEDYISLAVTRRVDEPQGPHPESRLMREEDELGEGEDEFAEFTSAQERIALGKKSRKREAARRLEEMRELIADAAEEDEETKEWEEEQLRRGHRTTDQVTPVAKVKPTYKPAPIPAMTPIPTLAPALECLTQQLAALTTSHATNTASLNSLTKEWEDMNEREKEMRTMVEKAEEKRAWFNSFRDWIEGVANFLDEKYPLLEKLEEEHVSLLKERHDMIAHRRHAEDEDDVAVLFGSLPSSYNVAPTSEGPDRSKSPTASKRERRLARIARRQLRQQLHKSATEEGYSTDSSLPPSDAVAYADALKSLASRKKNILSDVRAEEFHNPSEVRWNVWREKYTDSYVGAWGGLGVVSVWEFWARLECVGWDCIENPRSLDGFKWYKMIYEYSRLRDNDVEVGERDLGPEGDLVASMISTAIVPRLCKLVEGGALDVYSTKHIRRMVDLAEEIEASVEDGNAKLQILLKTTMARFETEIANAESLVMKYKSASRNIPTFDPEAIPARRRFLARQVKLLQNLLRWRKHTGERFGTRFLVNRLVEGCIIDIAENGWEAGGEEFARQAAGMLPNELIPARLKSSLNYEM